MILTPIESKWHGSENEFDRTGHASYIVGTYHSEQIWMADWSQCQLIHQLLEMAYKAGKHDGGEIIKQAVDHALRAT